MDEHMWSAFCQESANIELEKQAAIGQMVQRGLTGLTSLARAARKGWQGTSGLAKGQKGFSGAWGGLTSKARKMYDSKKGAQTLLHSGGLVGAGGLGLYGAKKIID